MKTRTGILAAVLVVLFMAVSTSAFAVAMPKRNAHINDFAHVVELNDWKAMDKQMEDVKKRTSADIVVVTIPALMPKDNIDTFADELFKQWEIGKNGKDNGVLIVISLKQHALRIRVGAGLKGAISDAATIDIMKNSMLPSFKDQKYGQGLMNGIKRVIKLIPASGVKTVKPAAKKK